MNSQIFCLGIYHLNRALLEKHAVAPNRVNLRVIGCLSLGSDVTPELVQQSVGQISLTGTITGTTDAVTALRAKAH